MEKGKLAEIGNEILGFTKKNSTAILTGLAVVGSVTTGIMAYKAGIRAADVIEEHKKQMKYVKKGDKEAKNAVMKETAKELAPIVIPPVIMGTVTTACILGSNYISTKRVAVLSVAYAAAERSVKDWQAKTEDLLGEKKVRQIKDAIMKDKLDKDPPPLDSKDSRIIMTGKGDVLCKDLFTGRFFRSNAERIGQAINSLSADCIQDMYVSLNDFYDYIDIPRIPMGDDFGWNVDDTIRGCLPISYTAVLTDDMQPCLCIDYNIHPRTDYRNLH